jgi:Na+/H+ antiporter
MPEASVHNTELIVLSLLLFVTSFGVLARKLGTPYPIVMVIGGVLLGLIPGIPSITLDPELIFLVVLPPLLYAAGWVTSWRDLCHNFVSVGMLAVGLVGFTVFGVAAAGPFLFHGFDWRIGLVLGAAAATTDAIAATAIAKRVGLPRRIADLLENESLLNDATGLLALEFATAIVVSGQTPSLGGGFLRLLYLILAGAASGLLIGRVVEWIERRIDDGPIEIGISILAPYAVYLAAEGIHASGVLAVVVAGLYLGRKSSEFLSPSVRLQAQSVWNALVFLLNGFVFVLIGLQLPTVLAGVRELRPGRLIVYGVLFSLLLIALRLIWTLPSAYVAYFIRKHLLHQNIERPPVTQVFLVGWTGMRGVLALAGAMSLPQTLSDGSPFPFRDLIVFLTFSVILVTLIVQGLTLPPLIRRLGLAGNSPVTQEEREHQEARRVILETAIIRLSELRHDDPSDSDDLYRDLELHYRHRLTSVTEPDQHPAESGSGAYLRYIDLSRALLEVERETALRLRRQGALTDEAVREIEHELDLNEARLMAAKSSRSAETF